MISPKPALIQRLVAKVMVLLLLPVLLIAFTLCAVIAMFNAKAALFLLVSIGFRITPIGGVFVLLGFLTQARIAEKHAQHHGQQRNAQQHDNLDIDKDIH